MIKTRSTAFAVKNATVRSAPLSDINITPLIDVMLVLLVMLILTIPVLSHKTSVDLPQTGTETDGPREVHSLQLTTNGATFWDGAAIDRAQLTAELTQMATRQKDALLRFEVAPQTRYDRFAHTISQVKRAGVTKITFVGNNKPDDW